MKKTADRTRDLVARTLLESGPATAASLSKKLKITPAGIRRHLDALVNSGALIARDPYQVSTKLRGRGRPSKVFVVTDSGREKFEQSYDDLAVAALKFMSVQGGRASVREFANSRANEIFSRAKSKIDRKKSLTEKSIALAEFLTEEGYAANNNSQVIGEELCQHHCPVAHVAAQFPEICEAETKIFSELLGTHVQRLATISHGDGVCTTFIPKSVPNSKSLSLAGSTREKK